MSYMKEYGKLIDNLYHMSNPIIRYRIDREFYNKKDIRTGQYFGDDNENVSYWLNAWDGKEIHNSRDTAYENAIAKLLEFGYTRENTAFDKKFGFLTGDKYWEDNNSFGGIVYRVVIYPFLIRAGYHSDKNISRFFSNRLETIDKTIDKYGYDLEDTSPKKDKKIGNEFVFRYRLPEALPSIYDLYAFAFYPRNNEKINKKIDKIIKYIIDERFQNIPDKAYTFDETNKRYHAFGNVFHACFLNYRRLLNIYLISHFKSAVKSDMFRNEVNELLNTRRPDGFFEFGKDLLVEKKNMYYIYHGSHMGLGESVRNKDSGKIESTFWMLKILHNAELACMV